MKEEQKASTEEPTGVSKWNIYIGKEVVCNYNGGSVIGNIADLI